MKNGFKGLLGLAGQRVLGVAWAPHSKRLEELMKDLRGTHYCLSIMFGVRVQAPLRYLVLALRTLALLCREKPRVVIAQNPPIFCPLMCLLYSAFAGAKVVVDHHVLWRMAGRGLLMRLLGFLEAYAVRRAHMNLAIHEEYCREVGRLGGSCITLYDKVPQLHLAETGKTENYVVFPCGGHPDEDLRLAVEAMACLRELGVKLLVTGRLRKRQWEEVRDREEVVVTGFLPRGDYERVLRQARVGLCLIKENPYTRPHIIYEYLAAELPFIFTKTPATAIFSECGVPVENLKQLINALRKLLIDKKAEEESRKRVREFKRRLIEAREKQIREVRKTVDRLLAS